MLEVIIMSKQSLAVKYRPKRFNDVVEQDVVKSILSSQLEDHSFKNCLLFTGSAGTGKTSSARIFGNEINDFKGTLIELDAASNNSVDDVRKIIEESKYRALDAPYKVFILDEVHSLSSQAWQALLKVLEEPVPTSVYILCTTDPQKIPATIMSRVQRYNFQKITHDGIVSRLKYIIDQENKELNNLLTYEDSAISFIAKTADGGMRDAITLLDKSIGYSNELTLNNVVQAIGSVNYDTMFELTDSILSMNKKDVITIIENIHRTGLDLKQFIKSYNYFVLDLCKYDILRSFEYLQMPETYEDKMKSYKDSDFDFFTILLNEVIGLNNNIKWEMIPKPYIESTFLLLCSES